MADTGRRAGTGVLPRLIEKSMVAAGTRAGRYRVLETIRAFAAERAAEAGELDAIRDAHAEHYASWLSGLHAADPSDEVLVLGVVGHSDSVLCGQAAGAIPMRAPTRVKMTGRAMPHCSPAAAQAAMA